MISKQPLCRLREVVFRLRLQEEQTAEQNDREDHGAQNAVLQIAAENGSHKARNGGTGGATEVSGKRKKRKHGGSAEFDALRRERKRTRPEDTDGEAADDASDQRKYGIGGKSDEKIAEDAEDGASHRCVFHGDLVAEFCVKHAGNAHRDGKSACAEQVTRRFIDGKRALRKGGYPLRDGKLGRAGADHHEQHEPEDLLRKELFVVGRVVFILADRIERNKREEKGVEKGNDGEETSEKTPMLNADEDEERRAEKDGCDDTPAVEGVEQTHDSCFVFGGAGFDDRAHENLQQTSADGVDHCGDQKTREAMDQVGQESHAEKPERTADMCKQDRSPIADPLYVAGGKQVGQQLRYEIDGDEQSDLLKRNFIGFAERKKKQRGEIDDDGLRDISDKASEDRMLVCQFVHKISILPLARQK